MDLNKNGVVGSGSGYCGSCQSHGNKGGSSVNKFENVAHMDLNRDGYIGNKPAHSSNYHQQGGLGYYTPYNVPGTLAPQYHQTSRGEGLVNRLEKGVHKDLNHDGRIGNKPT
ncbi:unnamed protein product [Rotaria sordida]|uniref:Uncharacterized protein n=1 Tax=Rotaria sordida TaxID=392033 RepID=A0A813TGU8_9BILA|nr:unnamed protein product [Rotaria sordida]